MAPNNYRLRACDLAFSPRGHLLYAATRGNIERLSWPDLKVQFTWPAPLGWYNLQRQLAISLDGYIAVSNWGSDIAVLTPNWEVKHYLTLADNEQFVISDSLQENPGEFESNKILKLHFDGKQNLWIFTTDNFLYCFDISSNKCLPIFQNKIADSISNACILPQQKSVVYISGYRGEAHAYHWDSNSTTRLSYEKESSSYHGETYKYETLYGIISLQVNMENTYMIFSSKTPHMMVAALQDNKCYPKDVIFCEQKSSPAWRLKCPSRTMAHAFHPHQEIIVSTNIAGDLLCIDQRKGHILKSSSKAYFPGYPKDASYWVDRLEIQVEVNTHQEISIEHRNPQGPAAEMERYDKIIAVNGEKVNGFHDFFLQIENSDRHCYIQIIRDESLTEIKADLDISSYE
ncbi:hypothetical protein [Candidatus Uabimicrobium amorphum]|uniref:PDZ domain-containing protein n=1 Tax=Uabimicrobium amorphum TaxID=2596890 RepID=A0A5S9IQP0_UABAM|nr:hypothetical protein [Candidatus Uabimicrobium amorphum]BBM85947.1 hypothetical protein UABAM_04333 [Candidatus Uabimicrobium amorphum]